MAALLATTEKVVRIISRGQVYEQVYLGETPSSALGESQRSLESGLLGIYVTALELLADSGSLFKKGTARRTLEAIVNPDKATGSLAAIAEQESQLLLDVQACETKRSSDSDKKVVGMLETFNDPIFRIAKGVNKVLEEMQDSQRIKILEWISSVQFGKHHDNVKFQRTPNTGDWLLQHDDFRAWEDRRDSALFWLQGSAGTGKTYLTSSVIDRVHAMLTGSLEVEGLAYFYCDKTESQRAKPDEILRSFVRQLCTPAQDPKKMQSKINQAQKAARDKGTDFSWEQCEELIQDCLDGYGRTTLIIDAMDECDSRSRSKLLKTLKGFMANSKKPVKIYIASRPDSDIRKQLKDSPNIAVSASSNQEDIKVYLDTQLDKMAESDEQDFLKIAKVKQSVIDRLLQRCQGMFQWASLQIDVLKGFFTKRTFMDRLDALPKDIQAAYDEIWSHIEAEGDFEKSLIKRALQWTMATHKPFTSTELLSAIRINSNGDLFPLEDGLSEQALLKLCKNFLTIDTQSEVWRFSHLSVAEYLETKEGWSNTNLHYQAASACLSYFINTYDRDFAELPPQTFDLDTEVAVSDKYIVDADKEVDPADLAESDEGFGRYHPFHIYMRHCWMHHVREAEDTEGKDLATILKKFLGSPEESSSQYRKWFNVLYKDGWFFFKTFTTATGFYESRRFGTLSAGDIIHDIFDEQYAVFGVCRMGLENIASEWLEGADFDVSRVNTRGHSLLALAVMSGSLPICTKLIEKGADVNQRLQTNRRYGSALVAAVRLKRVDMVQSFLDFGANINLLVETKHSDDSSPLSAAVTGNDIEMVKLLLEHRKADFAMSCHEECDNDILQKAYYKDYGQSSWGRNDLELVKLMLQAGADVNTTLTLYVSPTGILHEVIRQADVEAVRFLVEEAKADVNKRHGEEDLYPIELAAGNDRGRHLAEILHILCEAGADVNATSSNGKYDSALAIACDNSALFASNGDRTSAAVIEVLLKAGAEVNKKITCGEIGSPLAIAARESHKTVILQSLLDGGADVNMQLENGKYRSALSAAGDASDDFEKFTFLLLQAGATPESNLKPEAYRPAMAASIVANDAEKVKKMLNAGATVDIPLEDPDFPTGLAYSTILNAGILEALIEADVNVNQSSTTARYGSALIAASCFGQYQAAECLINADAAVYTKHSGDYATAIEAAEAPFSEADRACVVRFCKSNEAEADALLDKWGKQKPEVLELLKKNMPPPEVIKAREEEEAEIEANTIFTHATYSWASRSGVPANAPFIVEPIGPRRLRSGNYVI